MASHRCRTCGEPHFSVTSTISFPTPEKLAPINAVILDLLEAAREFESFGEGGALEFVEWLAIDCNRAASFRSKVPFQRREPAGRPQRLKAVVA